MPCVVAKNPGLYLIKIFCKVLPLPFILMQIETQDDGFRKALFVPALPHTAYLLQTRRGNLRIHLGDENVERISLVRISKLRQKFLCRRKSDRRHSMKFADDVIITPMLRAEGQAGRDLHRALRLIANWGFGLTSQNLQATPGLLIRHIRSDVPQYAAKGPGPVRFAVVLHLYYRELWSEFESDLRRLRQNFHLIVTTTQVDVDFETQIRNAFPGAEIHVLENRGRDVGPFLQLLHDGRLDAYPFICKLHGKRSGISGPRALFGEVWRRTNVADLIGTSEQVDKILERFEITNHIGMIGSSRFRLPNEFIQHKSAWAENKELTLRLGEQMGVSREKFRLDFFAGTMFWIRQEALAPLRRLGLTLADFPDENGAVDGQLEHAVERTLGAAPQAIGMYLDGISTTQQPDEVDVWDITKVS